MGTAKVSSFVLEHSSGLRTFADLLQAPASALARAMDDMEGIDEAWIAHVLSVKGAQGVDAEFVGPAEEKAQRRRGLYSGRKGAATGPRGRRAQAYSTARE